MVRAHHGPPYIWSIGDVSLRPHRLAWSRTPAFHAGNRGSNPLGDAINNKTRVLRIYMERARITVPFSCLAVWKADLQDILAEFIEGIALSVATTIVAQLVGWGRPIV